MEEASNSSGLRLRLNSVAVIALLGVFPLFVGFYWLWCYVLPDWQNQYRLVAALFCGVCVAAGLRVLGRLLHDVSLAIGTDSISRITLFGRQCTAWHEVTDFSSAGNAVCGIYAKRESMVIRLSLFEDPDSVMARLTEKLGPANETCRCNG